MEHQAGSATNLDRFESRTAFPMLLLAVAFVPLVLVPVVFEVSDGTERILDAMSWAIWGAFALEYGIRLYLAPQKRSFVKGNKVDLLVIILPFLRPLRVARSARSLRLLRVGRAFTSFGKMMKTFEEVLTRHNLHYALVVTTAISIFAAFTVESFERGCPRSEHHLDG